MAERSTRGQTRVLVVSGDGRLRTKLEELLRACGFAATAVPGAVAALRVMDERGAPDVLVSESQAGDLSGRQLIGIARTRWPLLPVVLFGPAQGRAAQSPEGVFEIGVGDQMQLEPIAAAVVNARDWSVAT